MGKNNEIFSTRSVYASCAVSSIIVIALWAITHNWIVLIAAVIAIPYLVTRLFHKEVNKRAKVPIVIMIILAILLSFLFLRYKDEEPSPVEQPTVIVDEQPEDEQTQEETDPNAEQQESSNSNSGSGGYRGGANFDSSERLPANYSNVGGSSDGSGLNGGKVIHSNGNSNHIQSSMDSQKELEEQIQQEVDSGKDKVDLENGITGVVDNRPQEEKPNDAPQVDIDKDNAQDITNEGESNTPPEQLPDDEQLKEDAEIPDDSELDDMFDQTKPTEDEGENNSDNTETPEDNVGDKEDVNTPEQPDEDVGNKEEEETPIENPDEDNNKEEQTTEPTEDNDSEENEETTPTEPVKTPVSITALDGSEAIAGDTVQFKVTGNVKTVEGLDGLDYSLANGYLTVNTQDGVATVISPVIIGADGTSTATASVTVNVLNFN